MVNSRNPYAPPGAPITKSASDQPSPAPAIACIGAAGPWAIWLLAYLLKIVPVTMASAHDAAKVVTSLTMVSLIGLGLPYLVLRAYRRPGLILASVAAALLIVDLVWSVLRTHSVGFLQTDWHELIALGFILCGLAGILQMRWRGGSTRIPAA
jgi:hypothetical protein